jgi:hypothetical protein
MSRRLTKSDLRQLDRDEYGATSPVYRYIRESYAELVARKVGRPGGPSWESFAQLLARQGQTNGKGEPLKADTARKLFRRVAQEVEARPTPSTGRPMANHRSRQRGDWEPPLARTERPAGRRAPPPPPPPKAPSEGAYDHLPEDVKAQLTAVDEQFAYLDRHIIRPKQRS